MANEPAISAMEGIESAIHFIRGHKVMLDSDLAAIYGVSTMRLNEQLKRNRKRFPVDFAFQPTQLEFANLISQIAISRSHGGRRKLPYVFTEHGAIMLASILNSPVAVEASVRVVRAFVRLREMLSSNKELARKFSELERRLDGHDDALKTLFDAIRELLEPPSPEVQRREIGFHIKGESRINSTKTFRVK